MRLIDADRLIKRLRKDPLFCLVEPYGIIGVIEAEHTVDAVPVAWILDNERMPKNGIGRNAILDMIEDWRKRDATH